MEPINYIDKNKHKFLNYLLRFIGEVFMLIVGILIALQIDNWATEKNNIQTLEKNLNYVLEDLSNNKTILNQLRQKKQTSIEACTNCIDLYKQEKTMSSEQIIYTLVNILVTNKFENSQLGFERIRASELYESNQFLTVRDKVREYDNALADLRHTEDFINMYITSLSLEMSKNGALFSVFEYIRMAEGTAKYKAPYPEITLKGILDNNKPLEAVMLKYELDAPTLISRYNTILKTGEELEKIIQKYQDEN
ncbi:MAG: hypothetical protein R2852_05880 [Bacteroidia bacterium]